MKHKFEDKRVLNIVGVLDTNEEGEYVINVETKDDLTEYNFKEILDKFCGQIISFTGNASVYDGIS